MSRIRKPNRNKFDVLVSVEPNFVYLDFGQCGLSASFDEENAEQLKAVLPLVHALRDIAISVAIPDKP